MFEPGFGYILVHRPFRIVELEVARQSLGWGFIDEARHGEACHSFEFYDVLVRLVSERMSMITHEVGLDTAVFGANNAGC